MSKRQTSVDYGVTVSGKGEVALQPILKGEVSANAGWHKVTKFESSTINTNCYSTGKLTPNPNWIFQVREGENHLEAEKNILLTVELPKTHVLSGKVTMFSRDIVLLDKEHKVLSLRKRLWARIRGLILSDSEYRPIELRFRTPPSEIDSLSKAMLQTEPVESEDQDEVGHPESSRSTHGDYGPSDSAAQYPPPVGDLAIGVDVGPQTRGGTEVRRGAEEPRNTIRKSVSLFPKTIRLIEQELQKAKVKGLI